MELAPAIVAMLASLAFLAVPVIHFCLALGVMDDALQRRTDKLPIRFLWPIGWALATLVFGFFSATIYWLIHHSSLDASTLRRNFDDYELRTKPIGSAQAPANARERTLRKRVVASPAQGS